MGNNSVTGHFVLNHYASQFKALVVSVEHRFYVNIPGNQTDIQKGRKPAVARFEHC